MSWQESASVRAPTGAEGCTLPVDCVARENRRVRPWQRDSRYNPHDRATIHRSAANASCCTRRGVVRGPLVGRRLRSSVFGAHSIHSLLHSVSWCEDPAKCSSVPRPPAHQGTAALRWQCHQRTARACDHPPFISSPSIPSFSSVDIPRSQGQTNHRSSCLTRRDISVSICGDAGQNRKVSRHNRERDPF